jgi:hypothetical protein
MFEAILAGLLLYLAFGGRKTKVIDGGGSSKPTNGSGGSGGRGGHDCLDGVPEPFYSMYAALLSAPNNDPGAAPGLHGAAQQARELGHNKAAACLEAAANQAKGQGGPGGDKPVYLLIQEGHMPYWVAQHYTGMGSRFREFETLNPFLLPWGRDANGVLGYEGWVPGVTVQIPPLWSPHNKPLPEPLTGGGKPVEPVDPGGFPPPPPEGWPEGWPDLNPDNWVPGITDNEWYAIMGQGQ